MAATTQPPAQNTREQEFAEDMKMIATIRDSEAANNMSLKEVLDTATALLLSGA
jgi:hypothetical protein